MHRPVFKSNSQRVGPTGAVLATDIAARMLALADEAVARAGLRNALTSSVLAQCTRLNTSRDPKRLLRGGFPGRETQTQTIADRRAPLPQFQQRAKVRSDRLSWRIELPERTVETTDIFEIMHTMRAMRRLKPDPVPDELIRKILLAGQAAANGGNTQRWRFLVLKNHPGKKVVQGYYKKLFDEVVGPRYRNSTPPPGSDQPKQLRQTNT
jgi:Nitroreductase family